MAIKIQGSTIIDDSRNIVNSGIATLNYQGVAEVTIGSTSVGIGSTNSLTITPQVTQTAIGVGTVEILTLASNINNQDIFSVIDETGGITHLTVTNAGLIGIGTTNPAEKLHLEAGNLLISDGGNEVFYVSKTGPNALSIQNQSSNPAFDVTGIGSVGIGTTQPSSTFQVVNAGSELFSVSSALSDVVFEIDTDKFVVNSSGNTGIGTTNPTQKLDVVGNVKVTGDTYISGNTGIGTTNPTEKVDVVGNVKVSGLTTTQNLYVTGVSTVSDLYVNGALYDANNSRGNLNEVLVSVGAGLGVTWKSLTAGEVAGAVEVNSSSPSTPYYLIGVEDATGITSSFYTDTDVVLTGDGRLGIGTTNPTEKLEVGGNLKVSGIIYGAINTDEVIYNSIQSSSSGIVTLTSNTSNQIVDSFDESSILNAKYQISVACTGQLAGSYENPSTASVGVITAGQFYIPGTYNNVRLYTQSGVGTDARANITVNGTYRIVGFTSAYNTLVTTSAHGLGTNQPISFDSSFQRAEYVTLVESDTFYTPVPHGIGTNEPVSFASSIFDSSYTGIAVTAGVGNTYYATGTGATSFTLEYNIGGGQIVGLGTTTFASPGNKVTLVGSAITAGTIYYATGTGTTTFTLSSESTGIGTIVGVAISTGLAIGCTISGGVSAVRIVNPGSGYNVGAALSVLNTNLNSPVGSGFSFVVSNAYTNYQTTEVLLMTNNSSAGIRTCDYIEYATLANNDILGTFDASLSGSTAQLRFSPIYQNSNIRYAKTSIIS